MRFNLSRWAIPALLLLAAWGCGKGFKEPSITGKPSDPPVTLRPNWQTGQRYIYRVDAVNSTQVPRRNTSQLIRAEVTVGQDIGLTVTNAAPDGSRTLLLELLAIQMETSADDRITMTFDSENKAFFYEDSVLAEKLQKLVGGRLAFRLSPENKITRVDGTKEFNALTSGGGSIRGVAGGVFNRLFSVPFFREVIEMGMLPTDAVRIGDKWTVSRPTNPGLWTANAWIEMNYTLKGWQQHDGTNCLRIDFTGTLKPNSVARTNAGTNQSIVRRIVAAASPNSVEGTVTGRSWFEPGISLPVETVYEQDITTKTVSVKRPPSRPAPATNVVVALESASGTNTPPPPPVVVPPVTNAPPAQTTTTVTKTAQHTTIKLIAIEPVSPAP